MGIKSNETIWGPAGIDLANVLFNGQTRPNVGGFVPPKLGSWLTLLNGRLIAVPYNALSTGPNIGLATLKLFRCSRETRIYEIGEGPSADAMAAAYVSTKASMTVVRLNDSRTLVDTARKTAASAAQRR